MIQSALNFIASLWTNMSNDNNHIHTITHILNETLLRKLIMKGGILHGGWPDIS